MGEILEEIPDDSNRWKDFTYLAEKEKRDLAAGKGFRRQLVDESSIKLGCIGTFYAKCRSTEPFVLHSNGKQRLLTPSEHAKVKTIDASLVSDASDTIAHQILGQSIVSVAFEALFNEFGNSVNKLLIDHQEMPVAA